jgi:hypothetical protein
MSLDDMIKEKRGNNHKAHRSNHNQHSKTGYQSNHHNQKNYRNNSNNNTSNHNNNNNKRVVVDKPAYVKIYSKWETKPDTNIDVYVLEVEHKILLRIQSDGNVFIYADVNHTMKNFVAMNTILSQIRLNMHFDGIVSGAWTVKNNSGWSKVLESDM